MTLARESGDAGGGEGKWQAVPDENKAQRRRRAHRMRGSLRSGDTGDRALPGRGRAAAGEMLNSLTLPCSVVFADGVDEFVGGDEATLGAADEDTSDERTFEI